MWNVAKNLQNLAGAATSLAGQFLDADHDEADLVHHQDEARATPDGNQSASASDGQR
jgi:hypothetical protein